MIANSQSRTLILRLFVLVWAAEVFYLSTASFGAAHSEPFLARLSISLGLGVSPAFIGALDSFLRTLAHVTEYAVFAILLYSSFLVPDRNLWQPSFAGRCVAAAAAYAFSDEFHQMFVAGRHASLKDCALDTLGSALAMLLIYRFSRHHANRPSAIQRHVPALPELVTGGN